jgi:hypothetical protein
MQEIAGIDKNRNALEEKGNRFQVQDSYPGMP